MATSSPATGLPVILSTALSKTIGLNESVNIRDLCRCRCTAGLTEAIRERVLRDKSGDRKNACERITRDIIKRPRLNVIVGGIFKEENMQEQSRRGFFWRRDE